MVFQDCFRENQCKTVKYLGTSRTVRFLAELADHVLVDLYLNFKLPEK